MPKATAPRFYSTERLVRLKLLCWLTASQSRCHLCRRRLCLSLNFPHLGQVMSGGLRNGKANARKVVPLKRGRISGEGDGEFSLLF